MLAISGSCCGRRSWLFNLTADAQSLFAGVTFSSATLQLGSGELAARTDPPLTVELADRDDSSFGLASPTLFQMCSLLFAYFNVLAYWLIGLFSVFGLLAY